MPELVTPFLALHGFSDADVRTGLSSLFALSPYKPTRENISVLELVVAAWLLEEAGYRVKIRKEALHD
jgi:hypothetical protein